MSCNPPLLLSSCPGRAPPQHAFNIIFLYVYVCFVCFVVVAMMAFCGSPPTRERKESHQEKKREKMKKVTPNFFFLAADLLISLLI